MLIDTTCLLMETDDKTGGYFGVVAVDSNENVLHRRIHQFYDDHSNINDCFDGNVAKLTFETENDNGWFGTLTLTQGDNIMRLNCTNCQGLKDASQHFYIDTGAFRTSRGKVPTYTVCDTTCKFDVEL